MASLLSRVLDAFGLQLKSQADMNNPAIWSNLGGTYPIYQTTNSGETITVERALSVGAFYAGVKFITQTIGMTPINVYERKDERSKEKVPGHPLHYTLHSNPNPYWTPMLWKQQMTGDAILHGNGYSKIVWLGRMIDKLIPLDPTAITTEFKEDGEPLYIHNKGRENEERISFPNMFHLPGFGGNFVGLSTILLAKETLGLALALEQHATRYFSNGAVLGGTIDFPERPDGQNIPPATINRLRASFRNDAEGVERAHKWHILEHGAKANPLGSTNVESQFLEARRFIIEEIARWLGLRQHTLGALERAIKSNIEEEARELLMFDLLPWFIKWEQVIKRDLTLYPDKFFAEFNVDSLLRGDTRSRWEAYKVAIEHGVMSPDEVRSKENFNPRDDGRGDRYWEPQANYSTAGEEAPPDEPPPEPGPPPNNSRARAIVKKAVDTLVRKEQVAIERWGARHASKPEVWKRWLDDWYEKHAATLVDRLELAPEAAREYCAKNKADVLAKGYKVGSWMPRRKRWLLAAAIEGD